MPGLTYWLLMKKKCGRSNKKMQLLVLNHVKYALIALCIFIEAVITQQPPVSIHVGAKYVTLKL